MELSQKMLRKQLQLLKPVLNGCSIETARKGQDLLGTLLCSSYRKEVRMEPLSFSNCAACRMVPRDRISRGRILYLHGGGYVCGDLEYAKGFGAVLAAVTGAEVLCPGYRLAPEHPHPAALEDAMEAYSFLLEERSPTDLVLCGESAGGGLIYAVCLRAKELGLPLPAGLVGISPWTDLTASGESYRVNLERDPSMMPERLNFYAKCYVPDEDRRVPLVSPLFGDLHCLPPSLLFVGGDEVMLDDTRLLHRKLLDAGCESKLIVAPELWHAYVLYCLKERRGDLEQIREFCADRFFTAPSDSDANFRLDNI